MQDFIRGVDLDSSSCSSGVEVDEMRAMQTSAVYACVRVISETLSSLPCSLYKSVDKGREVAKEHPLCEVLHDMANPEMTSFTFREVMMTALLLYGNAYAKIVRDRAGHASELWYLRVDRVAALRDLVTKKIKYTFSSDIDNKTHVFKGEQIFHIVGMSYDGLKGLSSIDQDRKSVGLARATEEFGARFFGYY